MTDKPFFPAPIKPLIKFNVLDRIDVRIGTIVQIEEMPNSEKLVKLQVVFGDRTRQIIVGMKQERPNYKELVGLQTLFVVNLKPRKIAGELSEGILFDIGYIDRIVPVLALPEKPVPNGSRLG